MLRFTIIPINPNKKPLPITEREARFGEEIYYIPPIQMDNQENSMGYGEQATMEITDATIADDGGVVDSIMDDGRRGYLDKALDAICF